jgi:glycerol-3-phosphate acyltransferase PlsY
VPLAVRHVVTADVSIVVAAYLLGSIPFGYVIPRVVRGEDIRRRGSGNVGASNVWRAYGWSLGLPVALLDVAKGLVPAAVGLRLGGDWVGVLAGAAAMVGHARPVFLGFSKGGKMVATAGGVALALALLPALVAAGVWIVVFAISRYASLASMLAAGALPLLCLAFGSPWPVVAFTAVAAVGVLALHRQNVRRLLAGTEPRFSRGATSRP